MKSTMRAPSGPRRAAHLQVDDRLRPPLRRDRRQVEPDELGRAAADVEDQQLRGPRRRPAARRRSPRAAPPPRAGSPRAAARSAAPPSPGSGCRCARAGRPRSRRAGRCRRGSAPSFSAQTSSAASVRPIAPRDRCPVRSSPDPSRTDLAKASTTRSRPPSGVAISIRQLFVPRSRAAYRAGSGCAGLALRRGDSSVTVSCAASVRSCAMHSHSRSAGIPRACKNVT